MLTGDSLTERIGANAPAGRPDHAGMRTGSDVIPWMKFE
jgi:hypothetical protein